MPTVFVPPLMRRLTGGVEHVNVEARTLREVLNAMDALYPGFADMLCAEGRLKPGIAAAIDGEVATMGLLQPVPPESEVHFLPALGGGV